MERGLGGRRFLFRSWFRFMGRRRLDNKMSFFLPGNHVGPRSIVLECKEFGSDDIIISPARYNLFILIGTIP